MTVIPVSLLEFTNTDIEITVGETKHIEVVLVPDFATEKTIEWSSADPSIATVSETGLVTGVTKGTTIVIATCGEIKAECAITVLDSAGIGETLIDADSDETILFDINGNRVNLNTATPGLYIMKSANQVKKIIIK